MTLFARYFVTKCLALGLMCLLINATPSCVVRDWGVRWVRRQCQPLLNSKYLHPVSHSHLCLFSCDTLLIKKSQKDTWHGWDLCHDWVNLVCKSQRIIFRQMPSPNTRLPPTQYTGQMSATNLVSPAYLGLLPLLLPTCLCHLSCCSEGPVWWQYCFIEIIAILALLPIIIV